MKDERRADYVSVFSFIVAAFILHPCFLAEAVRVELTRVRENPLR
jgi:hypothetical protein